MKLRARAGWMMMRLAVAAAVICGAAGAAAGQEDITDKFKDPIFRTAVYKLIKKTAPAPILDSDVSRITSLDLRRFNDSVKISDLSGIEYFIALDSLSCGGNQLTALDVSKNTALTYLNCLDNQLTALDVSKNTALTYLWCGANQLTALDVSKNTALTELWCGGNQLTTLDVSKNTALTELTCGDKLTTLDVSKNTALALLAVGNNPLTTLDVSKNTALVMLAVGGGQLTTLDLSKNTELFWLTVRGTQFTTLDLSKNTALEWLVCDSNQLTSLDVSQNTALTQLYCHNNRLTALDVSKNTELKFLRCDDNKLTTLDVSKNTALTMLTVSGNYFVSEKDVIGLNKSITTTFIFDPQNDPNKLLNSARVTPSARPAEITSISPVSPPPPVFTAGPNPTIRSSAAVFFYRNGSIIKNATLNVYDASGNFVAAVTSGAWDLRDARGRSVSEGTYLVRGAVKSKNGKQERVSLVIGVR